MSSRSGIQRVVRRGQQHFVAVVQEALQRHHDQLGSAIADVDVVQFDAVHALLLRVMHDRLARGEHTLGIRVAGRARQVQDHVLNNFIRRVEAERREIADVQLDDAVALFFEPLRMFEDGPANVVADIQQLVGFENRFHGGHFILLIGLDEQAG
jgi:hypothetical protein